MARGVTGREDGPGDDPEGQSTATISVGASSTILYTVDPTPGQNAARVLEA